MLDESDDPDRVHFTKASGHMIGNSYRQNAFPTINEDEHSGGRHRIIINSASSDNITPDNAFDRRPRSAVSLAMVDVDPALYKHVSVTSVISAPCRTNGAASPPLSSMTQFSMSDASLSTKVREQRATVREDPSSRSTILVIASFFVVGLIFLLSGLIVLSIESHHAFRITGSLMVGAGAVSFVLCGYLQQKNLKKFMRDWEQDLYFLNLRQTSNVLR